MKMVLVSEGQRPAADVGQLAGDESMLHGPVAATATVAGAAGHAVPHGAAPRAERRQLGVVLSVHEELSAIREEWLAFEQEADCLPYQLFGWLSTWQAHIGAARGTRPAVVIGRDAEGQVLFLLPLAVERRRGVRRLVWLGANNCDYNAPLLAPDFSRAVGHDQFVALWPEVVERIQSHPRLRADMICLERMPYRVGGQDNPFIHLPRIPNASTWFAHLADTWESFYNRTSSANRRGRDRRSRKLLASLGEIRFVEPTAGDEIDRTMVILFAQKDRSLAAMGMRRAANASGDAAFYRAIAADPSMRDVVHVCRLDVGQLCAGISFALKFRKRYYGVLLSHEDGEVARFSPGTLLLHEVMRHAIQAGCVEFDFTTGAEAYKRQWTDTEYPLFDHVAAVRWQGAVVARVYAMFRRVRRVLADSPHVRKNFKRLQAVVRRLRLLKATSQCEPPAR